MTRAVSEWCLYKNGETWGPYSEEQMEAMLQQGHFSAGDFLWNPHLSGWKPAEQTSFFTAKPGGDASSHDSI